MLIFDVTCKKKKKIVVMLLNEAETHGLSPIWVNKEMLYHRVRTFLMVGA
jgi:hypothetical protein